jgi:hypothetical protein
VEGVELVSSDGSGVAEGVIVRGVVNVAVVIEVIFIRVKRLVRAPLDEEVGVLEEWLALVFGELFQTTDGDIGDGKDGA